MLGNGQINGGDVFYWVSGSSQVADAAGGELSRAPTGDGRLLLAGPPGWSAEGTRETEEAG